MAETKPARANTSDIDDRPTCQNCGSLMWLATVSAKADNTEMRTFKCPACEIIPDKNF